MIQKIKSYFVLAATLFAVAVPAAVPAVMVSADCSHIGDQVSIGANTAASNASNTGSDCGTNSGVAGSNIASLAAQIVNIFSIVVGAVAVIMIIYGGFRYITSGGDSNRVGGAKNTLIYAIVGLIIVALAQIIVHFVLNTTSSSVGPQ